MIPQLADDHRRARLLGNGLANLNKRGINVRPVETNIVTVSVDTPFTPARLLRDRLAKQGVKALLLTEASIRFVTHRHITDEDVDRVVCIMRDVA